MLTTPETHESLAPAQSVLYRCLAEGFSTPTAERLTDFAGALVLVQTACEELYEVEGAPVPPSTIVKALENALKGADLPALQAEYTRLFVFGVPTTPCRLLESVQREGTLVGEAAEKTSRWYLQLGLEAKEREPDHLVTELEFLAHLTGTPLENGKRVEHYRNVYRGFLQDHLLGWGPELASKIRAATEEPLYLALVDLMAWLLQGEAERS